MPKHIPLTSVLGAAAAGALTAVAFPKFDLMFFAWISLIPLFFILAKARPRQGLLLGWIAGAVFYGILLYWIPDVPAHYGRLPFVLSLLIDALLVLLLASTWALFGWTFAVLRARLGDAAFFVSPFVWIALEYAVTHVLTGFPWGLLGVSQYKNTAFIQISAITGVYGVSFMLVLFQSCFVASIESIRRTPFAFATVAMAAVHLAGVLTMPNPVPGPETFTAAVIQGNVSSEISWNRMSADQITAIFEDHMDLTRRARQAGASLIIWPEFTVPLCFGCTDPLYVRFRSALEAFVEDSGATLVVGTNEVSGQDDQRQFFNSSLCIAPGRPVSRYAKMHLVPFGEYTPYRAVFGFVNKITHAVGELTPGNLPALHSFRGIPFGTPICYEIVFPDLVRRFSKKGARFLATLTNDGWYGRSSAPYQHFASAVLRAAENRRFLLRAATTGISGIIDPAGRVLVRSAIGTR
ncbi:MAG: apolipoprotein N-acyltransferase, partial [Candidatus Aminicenantales bacterium]